LVEKPLEVVEGGFGSESVGDLDGGFVAGLGAYQRGGLHAALEIAGDDEIELYFQRIQDIRELEAVAFAVFVQWAFLVEKRIGTAGSGDGVAEEEEIHRSGFHCKSTEVSGFDRYSVMNRLVI